MKNLKTYDELYESNDSDDWIIDTNSIYTWIDLKNKRSNWTGFVLYRSKKRINKDIDFKIKNNEIFFCYINGVVGTCSLTKELKIRTTYFIMFELITFKHLDIMIPWFNNEKYYFNDEIAETVENGKYLEQYKKLKQKATINKFKI